MATESASHRVCWGIAWSELAHCGRDAVTADVNVWPGDEPHTASMSTATTRALDRWREARNEVGGCATRYYRDPTHMSS